MSERLKREMGMYKGYIEQIATRTIKIQEMFILKSGIMEKFDKLSSDKKELVLEFINSKIEYIYEERRSSGTYAHMEYGKMVIGRADDVESYKIEEDFFNFWCKDCIGWIGPEDADENYKCSDEELIQHVMEHLNLM